MKELVKWGFAIPASEGRRRKAVGRFTLSAPQRPFYEPHRYRPSPSRREHIHGAIQPMHTPRKSARSLLLLASFVFGAMLYLGGY